MSVERRRFRRGGLLLTGSLLGFAILATGNAGAETAGGDPAYGEYLASACTGCHQIDGTSDGIPSITGWPAADFGQALKEYRAKTRPNEAMQAITARLTDEEIAALAAYFGGLN